MPCHKNHDKQLHLSIKAPNHEAHYHTYSCDMLCMGMMENVML